MTGRGNRRALVLGVGNLLMRDEGLGVRAVELFRKRYALPSDVACVDGGTAGMALLSGIKGYTHIFIIDAVSSGAPPAVVRRFSGAEIESAPPPRSNAHQLGIKELITIARFEGASPEIVLIGVVPEDISPGMELSAPVEAALPKAAEMIKDELAALGFKITEKEDARDVDNKKRP